MWYLLACFLLMMASSIDAATIEYTNQEIDANLDVTGSTTLQSLTAATRIYANGGMNLLGNIHANGGNFTVDSSGNVVVGGAMGVTGAMNLSGDVTLSNNADLVVTGSSKFYGPLNIKSIIGNGADASHARFTISDAGAITVNTVREDQYNLPSSDPGYINPGSPGFPAHIDYTNYVPTFTVGANGALSAAYTSIFNEDTQSVTSYPKFIADTDGSISLYDGIGTELIHRKFRADTTSVVTAGDLTAAGITNANGGIQVLADKFTVNTSGDVTAAGTLGVTGLTNADGGIHVLIDKFTVNTSGDVATAGTLGVTGLTNADGGIHVLTDKFTVNATGDVAAAGTLGVTGLTTLTGGLDVIVSTTLETDLTVNSRIYAGEGINLTGNINANDSKFTVDAVGNVVAAGGLDVTESATVGAELTTDGRIYAGDGINLTGNINANDSKFTVDAAGNVYAAGDLTVAGKLNMSDTDPITMNGPLTAAGGITVTNSGDGNSNSGNVLFGVLALTSLTASTTNLLLTIDLPDDNGYSGIVDVTVVGDIYNGTSTENTEIFTTRYVVSQMDKTQTATVVRVSDGYYNSLGGMVKPPLTGSVTAYAQSLAYDSDHVSAWTPQAGTININFLVPTKANYTFTNASVMYEIHSGGQPGHSLATVSRVVTP